VWQLLIGSATELIGGHFKRKAEEKQAQHERFKLEGIKHEANWDNIQATNSATSWKDEWFTVLFSIPNA
jgi:hypothetical protein